MPQARSYTLEELQRMGAKPKSYTIDELQQMGAKPVAAQNLDGYRSPKYPNGATATEIFQDQTVRAVSAIPDALTAIPSAVGALASAVGSPSKQWELLKGAAKQFAPLAPVAKAMVPGAVMSEPGIPESLRQEMRTTAENQIPSPDSEEWGMAADAAGANLGGIILGEAVPAVGRGLKAGVRKLLPPAEVFREWSAANKAKALAPTTLEGKAAAQRISPELAERGMAGGLRRKTIDKNVTTDLQSAGTQVAKTEARLLQEARPEYQIAKSSLLEEMDEIRAGLDPDIFPDAVTELARLRRAVDKLPEFASFERAVKLRRDLDTAVEQAGGFKGASSAADRVKVVTTRGVADIVRRTLNELDPALKQSNHDFWLARNAADIVERRNLGEVGKMGSGLPGRGSLLDDLLATSIGGTVGGSAGAVAAEAVNLGRQLPGWANAKSSLQQKLANFMQKPKPRQRLLARGDIRLDAPETSSVTGFAAELANQQPRRLALPSPSTRVDVTGTRQPSSGQVFTMPPGPTPPRKLLTSGKKMIPEKAGSPYVTPMPGESMREFLRRIGKR